MKFWTSSLYFSATLASGIFVTACSSPPLEDLNTQVEVQNGQILSLKGQRNIGGVYPHLTAYTHSRIDGIIGKGHESGIGALAVWQDKLYMITYAAHEPNGSEHKLYIIDRDKNVEVFQGSVGGTPAGRMIHQESEQLLIGPYVIDKNGAIRVLGPKAMPGRLTGIARHLKDPENMVYYYDMEGMLYEVNVNTLHVRRLFKDPLPGWHGKGAYTSQGRLVLSNNGEHRHERKNKNWQVSNVEHGASDNGVLAEFDGEQFKIVERRQYTDVTTQHGINAVPNDNSPLWSMGWDKKSVRLKLLDDGQWSTYLLPKATYNNDPSHGWFTEWPRIRSLGDEMMMDMHGMFYGFPATFSAENTAGISPWGSHLRYIPDFLQWGDDVVLATDETSVQGNPLAGQAQSNLWFGTKKQLKNWGPKTGYGAIWLNETVESTTPSLPYLIAGFDHKLMHLVNHDTVSVVLTLEVDSEGLNEWHVVDTISLEPGEYLPYGLDIDGEWIRLRADKSAALTAALHFRQADISVSKAESAIFAPLADIEHPERAMVSRLFSNKNNFNMTVFSFDEANTSLEDYSAYEFDKFDFTFSPGLKDKASLEGVKDNLYQWSVDNASVVLETKNGKLRLPMGDKHYDHIGQTLFRSVREVESERELANIHGSFYELPLFKVGQEPLFSMLRPVSSHNKLISDFNTWNGLLVLGGVKENAAESNRVYRSDDNHTALWLGAIDELWKLGKPRGKGGPWNNTPVTAGILSDPYLMTGYDKKTVTITADQDTEISLHVSINHYLDDTFKYKSFSVKAGEQLTFEFPDNFSAHWVRAKSSKNCIATVQFVYE